MVSNPSRQDRIFVDSSVLISASISKSGYARDLIFLGIDGSVQLVASAYVLEETRRNLARKSPGAIEFFRMFLELGIVQLVDPPRSLVVQVAHRVEPKDAAIIAGAIAADCPVIATFDRRHLLAEADQILRDWAVHVEMPGAIIQRLSIRGGED